MLEKQIWVKKLNYLTQLSLFLCSKVFLGKFSLLFLEHPMIKLQAKRFELNFLLKFSDLKSNFTLTLGYLNPALNNWGQVLNVLKQQLSSSWENPLRIFNIFILYLGEFKKFFFIIYQQWTSLHPGQMKVSKQK